MESPKLFFTLFIAGNSHRSRAAITSLRELCEEHYRDNYDLVIVDVLKQPELAEVKNILATPTLIREKPLPVQRVIGDLSDKAKLLAYLNLSSTSARQQK